MPGGHRVESTPTDRDNVLGHMLVKRSDPIATKTQARYPRKMLPRERVQRALLSKRNHRRVEFRAVAVETRSVRAKRQTSFSSVEE